LISLPFSVTLLFFRGAKVSTKFLLANYLKDFFHLLKLVGSKEAGFLTKIQVHSLQQIRGENFTKRKSSMSTPSGYTVIHITL